MNIKEFRQKYPGYNDIDDDTLANTFYEKYYKDMPRQQFMLRFMQKPDSPAQQLTAQPETTGAVKTALQRMNIGKMFEPQQGPIMGSKDVAPMLLSLLGGIGGTAGGPVGTAAGGTLGYAAGKNLNRAIGLDEQVSLPETARRTVMEDIPEGMLAESTGMLSAKGAAGLKNKLGARTVTPEMSARQVMYEKANVPYTAADIKQQKGLGLIEGNLRRNVASADIAQSFDLAKLKAIQEEAARVELEFGGKTGLLEAGQKAQESIGSRYRKFMNTAEKLYNAVPIDPQTPIETPKLRDVAIGYLDDLGKMGTGVKNVLRVAEGSITPEIRFQQGTLPTTMMEGRLGAPTYTPAAEASFIVDAQGRSLTNKQFPNYTWAQLNADKSALRKMAESTSDMNKKRILYDLSHAINEDISRFAETNSVPQIKEALDTANNFYKNGLDDIPGVGTFRDRQIWNTLRTNSPEKVVDAFIKPKNVSAIARLSKAAGPAGMNPIKSAWVSKMFEKGEGQSFSPARFATEFEKYSPADLSAFLSKEEIAGLKSLAELSRASSAVEKMAGNPSGTAQQVMTAGTIYSAVRHPVLTTMELIGANKFAQKYFTDKSFRNYLIAGSKVPANSQGAAAIATKLATIAGISGSKEANR